MEVVVHLREEPDCMSSEKQDCRVYVGNLLLDVLKDHMHSAGDASFAEVMQETDDRSRGCSVVEFKLSEEVAKETIDSLNDTKLKGRMIFVREDRETGGGGGGGRGGKKKNSMFDEVWNETKGIKVMFQERSMF